jgi:isopropylmalate/homocitrate/citramalate synthase
MDMNEWRICDTTLREGLQSGILLFDSERSKVRYADRVLGEGLADSIEVYRPGEHLSSETLDSLIRRWDSRVRVYYGVAHRMGEVPAAAASISVTLISSRVRAGTDAVRALASERPGLSVRVGLECVSRWRIPDLHGAVRELRQIAGVTCISLCDSLGELLPSQLPGLVSAVAASPGAVTGGHFHDDAGLAAANAVALLGSPAGPLEVEVTLGGIGERVGIAALETALAIRQGTGWAREHRSDFADLRQLAGSAFGDFDKTPFSGGRYVAESHRAPGGALREEYQDLY